MAFLYYTHILKLKPLSCMLIISGEYLAKKHFETLCLYVFKCWAYFLFYDKNIIGEWRRETRRETSRRSMQRASFFSLMGKQNNIITREILILAMWFIFFDVKLISVMNQPGPTRPGPAMTLFDGLFLKLVKRYELESST